MRKFHLQVHLFAVHSTFLDFKVFIRSEDFFRLVMVSPKVERAFTIDLEQRQQNLFPEKVSKNYEKSIRALRKTPQSPE